MLRVPLKFQPCYGDRFDLLLPVLVGVRIANKDNSLGLVGEIVSFERKIQTCSESVQRLQRTQVMQLRACLEAHERYGALSKALPMEPIQLSCVFLWPSFVVNEKWRSFVCSFGRFGMNLGEFVVCIGIDGSKGLLFLRSSGSGNLFHCLKQEKKKKNEWGNGC